MSNLTSVLLPIFITGDGVSLTAVVDLNSTAYKLNGIQNLSAAPVSVALQAAFDELGSVNTNVASVTLLGSQLTITFVAPFSGTIELNLALAYPVDGSPLTTPVNTFVKVTNSALPTGAATEATLAAITKPSDTQLVDGSAHVQPVFGPLTDAQLRATPVPVAISSGELATVAVTQSTSPWVTALASTTITSSALPTGASTEATLDLVKAKTDNIDVALSTRTKPSDIQQIRALISSDVVTTQQGTAPWATRATKDTGRTAVTFFLDNIAGSATEVLASMGITKGAAAQTAANSYTVTAGKTLRLTSINYSVRSSTNAQQISQLRVRTAASAIGVTSPIILNFMGEAPSALTQQQSMAFPDGYEIGGGTQIAMSHIEIVTPASTQLTVCLVGYEY